MFQCLRVGTVECYWFTFKHGRRCTKSKKTKIKGRSARSHKAAKIPKQNTDTETHSGITTQTNTASTHADSVVLPMLQQI